MGFIYLITNDVNGKQYVGKTLETIEERWKTHIADSKKERCKNRPLYRAFNKYGIEHFHIEEIEKVSPKRINEREQYWIKYYNTYHNGYNATLGGDGTHYIDYDKVVKEYLKLGTIQAVVDSLHIDKDTVRKALINNNIQIKSSNEIASEKCSKKIDCYDLNNNQIKTYNSVREAAEEMVKTGKAKTFNQGVISHISAAALGKRKTAYKFIWKYPN